MTAGGFTPDTLPIAAHPTTPAADPTDPTDRFAETGVGAPFRLLEPADAAALADALRRAPAPVAWLKGQAATSPELWRVATLPALVDPIAALLGDDVLLCGANLVERDPGQVHPWHTDTHLASPEGRAVSVWVALEGVTPESTLRVIDGSHRYGAVPQQLAAEAGGDPMMPEATALELARRVDPDAEVTAVDLADGDAVLFDEAMWHGTDNVGSRTRSALVLHYCTPDKPVRIHGHGQVWPFEFLDDPLPPCQVVRGVDRFGVNRIVPPPAGGVRVNAAFPLDLTEVDGAPDWKPFALRTGPTSQLLDLTVKIHRVADSANEHPLHAHVADTIAVMLGPGAHLEAGGLATDLGADDLVILPGGTDHRCYVPATTAGAEPATVRAPGPLQFDVNVTGPGRSPGAALADPPPVGLTRLDVAAAPIDAVDLEERGRSAVTLVDAPTATAARLRILRVDLAPGFVGEPDVDDHDVVLLVLAGRLATLDAELGPGGAAVYGAGETHQLATLGDEPVRLLAIEFTGGDPADGGTAPRLGRSRVAAMGGSELRRRVVRRLPRPVRLWVRRTRRRLRATLT